MLAYTTYSEAGGVGKTTLAANLTVAHARAGLDVLCVPLDPQDGDLSNLFGVDSERADPEIDTLVHHLADRSDGDFHDLIRTVDSEHGIDIIPEHNRLEGLGDSLRTEQQAHEDFGEEYNLYTQLRRVLRENGVYDDYNALDATRSLVLPFEPSGKGEASVEGLEALVEGLSAELDVSIGVLALVPNRVTGTTDQTRAIETVRQRGFDMPVMIGERASLLEGCWHRQCSAYRYVSEYRDSRRDYEVDTLAEFDALARHIEHEVDIYAPDPPTEGDPLHRIDDGKEMQEVGV
jgi:cellulose biosynthesis protein BcsQ